MLLKTTAALQKSKKKNLPGGLGLGISIPSAEPMMVPGTAP